MSGTHKERPRREGGGGGGKGGGDDDEEGGGGPTRADDSDDKVEQRCFRKMKRVSLFRFRKANKLHHRRRQRGNFVNSQCWGGGGGGSAGVGGGCCLCMKRPMTVGSSGESPTSDPNSAEFSYEMLRGLIEKNDFLSKDCNTHLMDIDVDSLSPCSH